MAQSSNDSKKRWLQANLHKRTKINRDCRLRTFYGITPEQYAQMILEQDNKCPICTRIFNTEKGTEPHVEHDHYSGWVRGIVCENCNHGLGVFHDDVESLERSISYLVENATPTEFNIYAARSILKKKSTGHAGKKHSAEAIEKIRQARLVRSYGK